MLQFFMCALPLSLGQKSEKSVIVLNFEINLESVSHVKYWYKDVAGFINKPKRGFWNKTKAQGSQK